jgi:hypothetical protein
VVAAIWLRKIIKGEWFLALGGILTLFFGVLLAILPIPGALDAAKQHLLAANLGFNRKHQVIVFNVQRAFFALATLCGKITVQPRPAHLS